MSHHRRDAAAFYFNRVRCAHFDHAQHILCHGWFNHMRPKNPPQVLAVFNAPNEVVDHEEHAVESATVTRPEWDGQEDLESVVGCLQT